LGHYFDSNDECTSLPSPLRKVVKFHAQHDEVGFVVAIAHEGVAHQTNNQKQHQRWLKSQKLETNLNES
jgi:hypothetical protein